jgi:hypothetical protein
LRIRLGLLACLLAGCAAQPTRSTPSDAPIAASAALSDTHAVVRIGLEFLPPDERFPDPAPVLAEPSADAAVRPPISAGRRAIQPIELRREAPSTTPDLATIDLEAIEDPVARETMNFCSDLIAADRLRVRREVGLPFFDFRFDEPGVAPLLTSERRLRQDHERWSQQLGTDLLKRPLRLLARRLPIAREFEVAVQEFRSNHVPLSEPYRKVHGDRRKLGRLSLRLDLRDTEDPVEVVYVHHSGVRIGSSQQQAKVTLDLPLTGRVRFGLRARTDYETGRSTVRSDLIYRASPRTSFHLAAGDDMDFLSTSSLYSLFDSPMDGAPGLVMYAVHTF